MNKMFKDDSLIELIIWWYAIAICTGFVIAFILLGPM